MSYDPYSDNKTSTTAEGIFEAVKPANLLRFKYLYDPSTWDVQKGIWRPFSPKAWSGAYSNIRSAFGAGTDKVTMLRGLGSIPKEGARALFSKSTIIRGSRFWGQKSFRATTSATVDRLKERAVREAIRTQGGTISKAAKAGADLIKTPFGEFSKDMTPDAFKQGFAKIKDKIDLSTTKYAKLAKAASPRAAMAAKVGIFAMKSVSVAMLALTAWEMSKMVSEPLGRYIVENANRVASEYKERFMPELGGHIPMSYMTSGAATERQRAVNAISKSYINGRSALGHEAELMHQ